jgi:Ca2+-binding RTX toxin-like protein
VVANPSDLTSASIVAPLAPPPFSKLDADLLNIDAEALDLNQAIARNPRLAAPVKAITNPTLVDGGTESLKPPAAAPAPPAPAPGGLNFIFGTANSETLNGTVGNDAIYGFAGDDVLNGKAGNDRLFGGQGDDVLSGDEGNDILDGGTGDDLLLGSSGNDQLFGRGGNDVLDGGIGNDQLFGEAGDDILLSSTGNDTLNGGAGTDVADYSGLANAVTIQAAGTLLKGSAGTDTLVDVEVILGSEGQANAVDGSTSTGAVSLEVNLGAGNFKVNGLPAPLQFTIQNFVNATGTGQNDKLVGDGGNNILRGGAGNDILDGGAGNDQLFGDAGNDRLIGSTENDTLNGGVGTDTADYSALANGVTLQAVGKVLKGALGVDTLVGMETILGAAGKTNVVDASTGMGLASVNVNFTDKTLNVNGLAVPTQFTVQNFTDAIGTVNNDILIGDGGANSLRGGAGNDVLDGKGGNDTLLAEAGDDWLIGSTGNDILSGSNGNDTADYAYLGQAITLQPMGKVLKGALGTDDLVGIETIVGAIGQTNVIDASTAMAPASVNVNLATNSLTVNGLPSVQQFTARNFVNVTGTSQNDTITGDAANNNLQGGAGNDRLDGGAGADVINGGAGNDLISGGDGNDVLIGGDGDDSIFDTSGSNTVIAGAGNDRIEVSNKLVVYQGLSTPIGILGGAGNQPNVSFRVVKGEGSNLIGTDTFVGDLGQLLVAQNDRNYINYSGADPFRGPSLNVDLSTFSSGAFNRAKGSSFQDQIVGNNNSNVLVAVSAFTPSRDTLNGQGGDDILVGSQTGGDTLTGGSGVDRFELSALFYPSNPTTFTPFLRVSASTITDFDSAAGETIKINDLSSGLPTGVLSASAFEVVTSGSAATRESTRLIYNKTLGELYFDFNGTGVSEPPFGFNDPFLIAKLTNKPTLSASNFVIGAPTDLLA